MLESRSSRRLAALLGSTALVAVASASSSFAGNVSWIGSTTDWQSPVNWTGITVPGMTDTVTINTTNAPAMLVNGMAGTTGSLLVGTAGSGSLWIDNGLQLTSWASSSVGDTAGSTGVVTIRNTSSWVLQGVSLLEVGKAGNGTLDLAHGSWVTGTNAVIGTQGGSTGLVTIDGTNSKLQVNGTLTVGNSGKGTINITNGGKALGGNAAVVGAASGGTGFVTVDGANSWFSANAVTVGSSGTGTVTVTNGGTLGAGLYLGLGYASGASGTVTITGAGSKVQVGSGGTGNVFIGDQGGTGTLKLQSGASGVVSGNVTLGNTVNTSGTLDLSGSGTTLAINSVAGSGGGFYVGYAGNGTANLSNSASLTADNIYVGSQANSQGTLTVQSGATITGRVTLGVGANSSGTFTVTGAGTNTTVGAVTVGDAGTGFLNVLAGGKVTGGFTALGFATGGSGTITVDGSGSRLDLSGNLYDGSFGAGAITVSNGGVMTEAGNTNIGFKAGASGSLSIKGAGSQYLSIGSSVDFNIGINGAATVDVSDGGKLVAGHTLGVGMNTGTATLTVDGTGSVVEADRIYVGSNKPAGAKAVLNVVNGGAVNVQYAELGSAVVSGAGSALNVSSAIGGTSLVIGSNNDSVLTLNKGGAVNAAGNVVIAQQAGSNGHLYIGSLTGGTPATAPGTLTASGIQFGDGTGGLIFNHTSAAYTFAVPISGNGSIDNFAGHTILTGDSSGFTGFAGVAGGILSINGSLANGNFHVQNGGTLGGTGTIGTLDVTKGGIVAPGNSIGTLTVANFADFANGTFYQVQLDAKGNSDKLVVGTTTTINGGTVQAQVQAGSYAPSTKYTILTSAGGVTGTFAGATSDAAFLTPSLSYDANDVYLTMTRNVASFASVGATPNQAATGGAVDPFGYGNRLWNAVVTLNAAQARSAFDQLSGDIHPSTLGVLVEDSRFVRAAAIDRLRESFSAVGTGSRSAMAYAADPATVKPDAAFAVWGRVIGSWGRAGSDGNAAALSHNTGGFFSGIDSRVGDDWRVGVLSGYTHANLSSASDASRASVESYHFGGFAGAQWGAIGFRSGAAYSWHHIGSSRTVAIPGFTDQLSAGYGATTAQAFGELGYRIDLSRRGALEPFAALAYVDTRSKGFTEAGGDGGRGNQRRRLFHARLARRGRLRARRLGCALDGDARLAPRLWRRDAGNRHELRREQRLHRGRPADRARRRRHRSRLRPCPDPQRHLRRQLHGAVCQARERQWREGGL
ncbi:autotransporter outer membrane beta-barrel domain-containing protein [Bradyrhizobium liaoningense]|nr:autotransporter domain-containing protein [Bradyrhizobium liaoningense]MBR0715494.1 autotransporter outer membrane beta-barrel domain-containing protein [Bradyrhizobium liaoningense]